VLSGSQCLCPQYYSAVSSTAVCTVICGSGTMPNGTVKQCDDGNSLGGDGCSSTCTIETGFTCDNLVSPSICTSNTGYTVSSQTLTKSQNSNILTATLVLSPIPPASTVPTLTNQQDTLSLQSYSLNRETLTLTLNLLQAVSSSSLLNIRLALINTSTALPLVDSNNAQLVPYAETYYNIYDAQAALIWVYIAFLWAGAIYRLITDPKLISQVTEVFIYTAIAWIGV
jgi:cysteine-rich repeat protein